MWTVLLKQQEVLSWVWSMLPSGNDVSFCRKWCHLAGHGRMLYQQYVCHTHLYGWFQDQLHKTRNANITIISPVALKMTSLICKTVKGSFCYLLLYCVTFFIIQSSTWWFHKTIIKMELAAIIIIFVVMFHQLFFKQEGRMMNCLWENLDLTVKLRYE